MGEAKLGTKSINKFHWLRVTSEEFSSGGDYPLSSDSGIQVPSTLSFQHVYIARSGTQKLYIALIHSLIFKDRTSLILTAMEAWLL